MGDEKNYYTAQQGHSDEIPIQRHLRQRPLQEPKPPKKHGEEKCEPATSDKRQKNETKEKIERDFENGPHGCFGFESSSAISKVNFRFSSPEAKRTYR